MTFFLNTLLAVLFLSSGSSFPGGSAAIGGTVVGKVTGVDGEVLAGANIVVEGTGRGAATGDDGQFVLTDLVPGRHVVGASYVGYEKVRRTVTIEPGDTVSVHLVLLSVEYMPQIDVVGLRPERLIRVPGSAAVIDGAEIARGAPLSSSEIFRRVAGVHAVEEEGGGLRANIGIRGLDPDRSRTVLMLEDGVPVALAPYGEPEMYYTPSMHRMVGLEIVKGNGSILFGPQTFGGVVNYLTADPPPAPAATVHLRGGEGGLFVGKLGFGNTIGRTGIHVTYLRRHGAEIGSTEFSLNDVNAKLRFALSGTSFLGLKLAAYEERSNSTYVGLTQGMYDSGLYDFVHVSPEDHLIIRRYALSATHDHFFSADLRLKTTAFAYTTRRDWMRQDFDVVPNASRTYDRIVGADTPGSALYFRTTTGNRNRQFEVAGFEPRLSANYQISGVQSELDAGFRVLYERAFEQRVNGTVGKPFSGILAEDEVRTGFATSAFVQNRVKPTERLSITPGVRIESFGYGRDIRRLGGEDVAARSEDHLVEILPGLGANYQFGERSSLFAGVHRGFGPPRVKDAISSSGRSQELDAEKSWNYEIGTRWSPAAHARIELTGFFMDFSNQIIPVSESAGGPGRVPEGVGLINGGETRHTGIEAGLYLDASPLIGDRVRLSTSTSVTYTRAWFHADRFVVTGTKSVNVKGNHLPYAPEWLVSSVLDGGLTGGAGLRLTATYIGRQFGDVLNRKEGTPDGRQGMIDPYLVIDLLGSYPLPGLRDLSLNVSVKNLFDERYIVSRRPQGIRVGLPRFMSVGVDWKL